MMSKRNIIICSAISLVVALLIIVFIEKHLTQEDHKTKLLLDEIRESLDSYYAIHQEYPPSLDDLHINFPEGCSRDRLLKFTYRGLRSSYRLTYRLYEGVVYTAGFADSSKDKDKGEEEKKKK